MIKTQVEDGFGTGRRLRLGVEGTAQVVVHPHPPQEESLSTIPYRQYLTDDGTTSGSNDMRVDGSTTPQTFCIKAVEDFNLYIRNIAIVISDAGANLSDFGSIAALTNGIDIKWITQDLGTVDIATGLKSNFDFVQTALGQPAFGTGTSSFRANNVVGTSEAYIPVISFPDLFGFSWGIRLRKGTKDKICFTINDNITSIDRFDALAAGIKF